MVRFTIFVVALAASGCDLLFLGEKEPASELIGLRVDVPCIEKTGDTTCRSAMRQRSERLDSVSYPATVRLRVRGVLENAAYVGGTNEGNWNRGGTLGDMGQNPVALEISAPESKVFLNDHPQGNDQDVINLRAYDYEVDVEIDPGAIVKVVADPGSDGIQLFRDQNGSPVQLDEFPIFDGQFAILDVLESSKR